MKKKKLWKNLSMDKFFQHPLPGDYSDINFLGQNPFSKTVLFIKQFFQDSFSYHNEMVTLSKEIDVFVSSWWLNTPLFLLAGTPHAEKGSNELCVHHCSRFTEPWSWVIKQDSTERSLLVILCEQKFTPVGASSDFMPCCQLISVL